MVSETVDKILYAEKQAAETIESAYQKSEKIIFQADEYAKEIINKANLDIEVEVDHLMRNNQNKINEIFENSKMISSKEVSDLKTKAQAKQAKAIDMVIAMVLKKK